MCPLLPWPNKCCLGQIEQMSWLAHGAAPVIRMACAHPYPACSRGAIFVLSISKQLQRGGSWGSEGLIHPSECWAQLPSFPLCFPSFLFAVYSSVFFHAHLFFVYPYCIFSPIGFYLFTYFIYSPIKSPTLLFFLPNFHLVFSSKSLQEQSKERKQWCTSWIQSFIQLLIFCW